MAVLEWDNVGTRQAETGIDHGVLYLSDGSAYPWNGLTSVEESGSRDAKIAYLDGVKYLDYQIPQDFSGTIKAFTYPDAFNDVMGLRSNIPGFYFHDQPSKLFSLSYRTKLINDLTGEEYGYRLHIVWNIQAQQSDKNFQTIGDSVTPLEFSWAITATPEDISNYRPTAHISIDSTELDPAALNQLIGILYGTDDADAGLPSLQDLYTTLNDYPSASFTISPNPIVAYAEFTFDGGASTPSSGATITDYRYEIFQDGDLIDTEDTGTDPVLTTDFGADPGEYSATLTVLDSVGKTAAYTVAFEVVGS